MKKNISIFFIIISCYTGYSQPYFQKQTSGELPNFQNSNNQSAWGDYNNDGFLDLIISSFNDNCITCTYPLLLFKNNGNGTFTRINTGPIAGYIGITSGVTWGDYNNDGNLDLFVSVHQNNNNLLFKNDGNGVFTQIISGSIVNDGGESRACAWSDYNRDGYLDLFVCNQDNQNNFLYRNNGNGTFTRITTGSIVNNGGWSRGCMWGDYDNDNLPDLYVVNYQGQTNFLYHNNRNETFTRITSGPAVNDIDWGSTCNWADYDNDSFLDLYVTNNNSTNKFYRNNGDGTFTSIISSISNWSGYSYTSNWSDYDNDGWIDLFIPVYGSYNRLYKNLGGVNMTLILSEIISLEGGTSIGGAWGDYDNNGKIDLFATNTASNTVNYLYKNIGQTGNYIICKLKGCQSNRSGIGSRIKVYAGDLRLIREVSSGNAAGNMLWQHFGLGSKTIIDSIIVSWPFGTDNRFHKLTNVNVNQSIVIDECTIGIISSEIPVKYELKQNYPNPFNPTTQIEYSLLKPGNVNISVYDISGKLIRTLVNSYQSTGTYRENFDGVNLSSGIYIYKIETGEFSDIKKMILVK